jgi:hypothetical protein
MRLILFITLFTSHLFALINTPMHTEVIAANEKELTIPTIEGSQVGMYGAVVRWFDDKHSTALSWVEVKSIEGEKTILSMIPIRALEQSALPSGNWTPRVGDEVVLGYNYHRALLIAPNPSIYKKITSYHTERQWVHPDIFASVISSKGHPTPLREDFSYACRANNIGVVYFMFDKSIMTLDCHSFKILQNKSTSVKSTEQQLPFYTRVPHIEANWFGEGSDELEEYDAYYIELIAENNPENSWIQTYKRTREQAVDDNKDVSWFDAWFGDINRVIDADDDYDN